MCQIAPLGDRASEFIHYGSPFCGSRERGG